jgi:WD40 repeat protein
VQLELPPQRANSVTSLAFSSDGQWLVTATGSHVGDGGGGGENMLCVFEAATGTERWSETVAGRPNFVRFAPGGRTFAMGTSIGLLRIYDLETGSHRPLVAEDAAEGQAVAGLHDVAMQGAVRGAVFSLDGARLYSVYGEIALGHGGLAVWDLASGERLRRVTGLPAIHDLERSHDGARLLLAVEGAGPQVWLTE